MRRHYYIYITRFLTLLTFLLGGSQPADSQDRQPFFKHLTVEDGLSHNWVKAILKDRDGFMWFGTFNGLNRYDGRQFKIFQADSISRLSDNVIECLAEDRDGNLWVGTFSGGLNRFDRQTQTFTTYKYDPVDPGGISGNRINVIFKDKDNNLWIGTDRGLDRFNAGENNFAHYIHLPQDNNSLTRGAVTAICEDHEGFLWIGTEYGLTYYDAKENTWKQYAHSTGPFPSLQPYPVKSIYEDKYGHLWIGTWGGGLDEFDPSAGTFRHHLHAATPDGLSNNAVLSVTGDREDALYIGTENGGLNVLDLRDGHVDVFSPDIINDRSINSNSVHQLYFDPENGILWAGTYNGGVNYFSVWDKPFIRYQARLYGLNNNHITSLVEDHDGQLWIGTDGGGINVLNKDGVHFNYFNSTPGSAKPLQSDAILTILCDRQNAIWAGSFNGGIDVIRNGKITHFTHNPNDPHSLSGKDVSVIYEDRRGNIWAGTMSGGLNLYQPATNSFLRYTHVDGNDGSILDNFIYAMLEDRNGRLLVLTGKGIEVYDYRSDSFSRFSPAQGHDIGVPVTLMEDSQGNLWIGSQEKGLFRIDRTGVKVNQYTRWDGLPSNSICGILEDENGNLWVSTQRGMCKFEEGVINPAKVNFHGYSTEDGLQGNEFKTNAYCRMKDGRMAFGGQNGFNIFDPSKIKHNPFIPPVMLTGFKVFNREVKFGEGELLTAPVNEVKEITLNHHQSVFTFEFSCLNYLLPEKNQFAYRMENFEDEWNNVGNQRTATYSNLDPGEYFFRVKAANNDGVWNEEGAGIRIIIVPPWYELPLVRLGFILLGTLCVIAYFRYRTLQLRRSKKELERQVDLSTADLKKANVIIAERQKEILLQNERLMRQNQELENQTHEIRDMAEEIRELNEARTTFFSNISRELKAPLDLIVRQIEELRGTVLRHPDQVKEKQGILYRNAKNMVTRIKQLLDLSHVDDAEAIAAEEEGQEILQPATLLVVDADPDPVFVQGKFSTTYQFDFAADGASGLKLAMDNLPDLILCSIILPDMEGQTLCRTLRQDPLTSHIPVIVITSRNPDEATLKAIAGIADDHIAKPCQADLLDVKIRNLFFSRQKMREFFFRGTTTLPDDVRISEVDEQFLQKAASVVRANLQKSSFGVDEFSAHFGMSRRNVLRKMKGVTGLSINEYIRNTRLHEAYALLNKGDLNISEIAYTVGFTDPKYFSNCFKKLFGKLPSEVKSFEQKV